MSFDYSQIDKLLPEGAMRDGDTLLVMTEGVLQKIIIEIPASITDNYKFRILDDYERMMVGINMHRGNK